jgi:hypothetical protein
LVLRRFLQWIFHFLTGLGRPIVSIKVMSPHIKLIPVIYPGLRLHPFSLLSVCLALQLAAHLQATNNRSKMKKSAENNARPANTAQEHSQTHSKVHKHTKKQVNQFSLFDLLLIKIDENVLQSNA